MSPASVEHILNSIDIEKMSARTVWEKRQNEMRTTTQSRLGSSHIILEIYYHHCQKFVKKLSKNC